MATNEANPVGSSGFSPVTSNDHAGNVWIITILSLIYGSAVAAVRAYTKFRMYGSDDILIGVATVLHFGQAIAVFVGLNNGFGKFNSITTQEQWATSSRAFLAVEVMCLLALSLTKCSLLSLVLRIIGTRTGKTRPFCLGFMGLSSIWGIGSVIALLGNGRGNELLTTENEKSCPRQSTRWAAITAVDITTEIMTWVLVALLSSTVNMSFKRKCQVVLAFSFRLPLVILSALHYTQIARYPSSAEPQFAATNSTLFLQVMLLWSFISATIPNLKNFMKSFSIGMGLPVTFDITGYGSGNTYAMHSMSKNKSKTSRSGGAGGSNVPSASRSRHNVEGPWRPQSWRPDVSRNNTIVQRSENRDNISESEERNGSQELIINKEVEWTVTYDRNQ